MTISKANTLTVENKFYKTTTVVFKRTHNGVNVYEGKIQSKRGKKNHPVFIHHSSNMLRMVVIEGTKELKFYGSEFSVDVSV